MQQLQRGVRCVMQMHRVGQWDRARRLTEVLLDPLLEIVASGAAHLARQRSKAAKGEAGEGSSQWLTV